MEEQVREGVLTSFTTCDAYRYFAGRG